MIKIPYNEFFTKKDLDMLKTFRNEVLSKMKPLDGSEGKKFDDLEREESLQFHIVHAANTIDTFLEKSLDS